MFFVNGGYLNTDVSATFDTWLHIAMVYKGPNEGEGITVYLDGVSKGNIKTWNLDP